MFIYGNTLNQNMKRNIYNQAKKFDIFATKSYFIPELGVISACDDWSNPIEDNKTFEVFPVNHLDVIEKDIEYEDEEEEDQNHFKSIYLRYNSYPGSFREFWNTEENSNYFNRYFDNDHNLNIFTRALIRENGTVDFKTRNNLNNPFSVISGVKILKKTVAEQIKKIENFKEVYILSMYEDTGGESYVIFISLNNDEIKRMNSQE